MAPRRRAGKGEVEAVAKEEEEEEEEGNRKNGTKEGFKERSLFRAPGVIFVFSVGLFGTLGLFQAHLQSVLTPPYLQVEGASPLASSPSQAVMIKHLSQLCIVDMHADPLLSSRDLLWRAPEECTWWKCSRSHVDVPRMIEGNMGIQVMAAVTQVPWGYPYSCGKLMCPSSLDTNHTEGVIDVISVVAALAGWPFRTWRSLKARATFQAKKVFDAAKRARSSFYIITAKQQLETYLEMREMCVRDRKACGVTASLLAVEGAHALEGSISGLNSLYNLGYRMLSLSHFGDNAAGGSQHGVQKGGLTDFGAALIRRMEELGMILDLAHSSMKAIDDALEIVTKPFVVSHTGASAICKTNRTLSDEYIKKIAAKGGVLGVGYWPDVTCGSTVESIIDSIKYFVSLVGVDHVGLGSDWDGSVAVPKGLDARGIWRITEGLDQAGFNQEDIEKIMGGNAVRVFLECLPEKPRFAHQISSASAK